MKIRNLTSQGFRGFNKKIGPIDFNDKLTLIYGPNSYGKTSFSEALEWLLFGITSKVDRATLSSNKQEFIGSYRNCHFSDKEISFVEAIFYSPHCEEIKCKGELLHGDAIKKYFDDKNIDEWPWASESSKDPRPFILQHDLKSLLLVNPTARYKGFTRLIGAEELDQFQEDFVSFCTKFNKPPEVQLFLNSFQDFDKNLSELPKLNKIYKIYTKNPPDFDGLYSEIHKACANFLTKDVEEKDYLAELNKVKTDATKKIFDKKISLINFSESENNELDEEKKLFLQIFNSSYIKKYLDLITLSTIQHIMDKAKILEMSEKYLKKELDTCPLTDNPLYAGCYENFISHSKKIKDEKEKNFSLQERQESLLIEIKELNRKLSAFHQKIISKSIKIIELNDPIILDKMESILGNENNTLYQNMAIAIKEIVVSSEKLSNEYNKITKNMLDLNDSIEKNTENQQLAKSSGESIIEYIKAVNDYQNTINMHFDFLAKAEAELINKLELIADTKEISSLIRFLENKKDFKKKLSIQLVLSSMANLRKIVDIYVTNKLANSVKDTLSKDVMEWYGKIRTDGDPNVHFDSFDLPQTKSGDVKSRRIDIIAKSYGKRLPSAVSSLSESKLNALGFAISISNNVKCDTTFDFLVIDDPVQSFDNSHASQIIDVIRTLIDEYDKQVILLSHDLNWINLVRAQCRTINGFYYEIINYSENGPNIQRKPWTHIDDRINEITAIINNPEGLSSVEKQRIATEFRLLINELACDINFTISKERKNPDKFNQADVRSILIKSRMDSSIIDKICAIHKDSNDPHHNISSNLSIDKIRNYLKDVQKMKIFLETLRQDKNIN